ncbi:MAG: DUF192 domain-containing protein [Thermomicrobiales bacterium]|nr:DUF192 domain-containing protein [Thermomicrobiales bacterium]
MIRRTVISILAALMICTPLAVAAEATLPPWRRDLPDGREQATIVVGETEVTVDLALTSSQQSLGLGYRNGLDEDHGMLFVFDNYRSRTFWMKGMRFCLDIIWIRDDVIVGAAESVCPDPDGTIDADRATFESVESVNYVLEMDAGWLDSHGYGPGTHVDFSQLPEFGN